MGMREEKKESKKENGQEGTVDQRRWLQPQRLREMVSCEGRERDQSRGKEGVDP
jgi:hypothetical protein